MGLHNVSRSLFDSSWKYCSISACLQVHISYHSHKADIWSGIISKVLEEITPIWLDSQNFWKYLMWSQTGRHLVYLKNLWCLNFKLTSSVTYLTSGKKRFHRSASWSYRKSQSEAQLWESRNKINSLLALTMEVQTIGWQF
jgi:hypothetical protein